MTKWYPNFGFEIPRTVQEAFRRVLDFVYELRDQLGPTIVWAKSTEQITIGTDRKHIPGCQLTLERTGRWLVSGTYTMIVDGDGAKLFTGSLRVGTEQQLPQALLEAADATTATICQQWLLTIAERNTVVSLEIVKETGAAGTSTAEKEHCTISATWQGAL